MAGGQSADGDFEVIAVKEFASTSSGTLTDSAAGDIKCDARIKVSFGGTDYYIPLYDTAP